MQHIHHSATRNIVSTRDKHPHCHHCPCLHNIFVKVLHSSKQLLDSHIQLHDHSLIGVVHCSRILKYAVWLIHIYQLVYKTNINMYRIIAYVCIECEIDTCCVCGTSLPCVGWFTGPCKGTIGNIWCILAGMLIGNAGTIIFVYIGRVVAHVFTFLTSHLTNESTASEYWIIWAVPFIFVFICGALRIWIGLIDAWKWKII